MRFSILFDANEEANLDEIVDAIDDEGLVAHFENQFYDDSGIKMTIVLMCRNPALAFKQRIRFSKKENKLYMDIILDLATMSRADAPTRKRIVAEKMVNEISQIVAKYKFKGFDLPRFSSDLREWFEKNGWVE